MTRLAQLRLRRYRKWLLSLPIVALLLGALLMSLSPRANPPSPRLLLRVDDQGMNHATNAALRDLAATGMPFSASLMVSCPWYQEAVEILKENPQISVGIHLTLNAEWKNYRWGPVLGASAVPSLVDEWGHFFPSTKEFLEADYQLDEVRRELEAQIERGLATGLSIDFVDFHMRTALATPKLQELVTNVARKYQLRMSMHLDEAYKTLFDTPPSEKKSTLLEHLSEHLDRDRANLVIIHAAHAHPEMQALLDLNNPRMSADGMSLVAQHRQAELDALLSREVQAALQRVELITYRDVPNPFAANP